MKTIIFLLIAAVIVGGIALYGLFGDTSTNQSATSQATNAEEQVSAETSEPKTFRGEGSLEELQRLGTNIECRVSYDSPDLLEPVIGTYFVANNRVRGDFEMNVPEMGGDMVSSVILDGDTFYTWSIIDGEAYGIKADTSSATTDGGEVASEPVPSDAQVSYDCKEWREVDGSIFVPPSDVLFQDASSLLETGMEYGTVYEEGEF